MTSPNHGEVTGVTMTPDGKTMWVGIQHPGEDGTATNPTQFSNWPQGQFAIESDGMTALPARPSALVFGGHHQERRRRDRQLIPPLHTSTGHLP